MAEYERKLHAGDTFIDSIRNVIDSQKSSLSRNFTNRVALEFPGHVRSFQEKPFKLMMGNYDQLRIGAEYFNKIEFNFVCLDSSRKLWGERQKKN